MPSYSQEGRSLQITTPLGADQLLLTGFRGQEAISQPFRFELELLAEVNAQIRFEDLIGQSVTVQMQLPNEEFRYFNGMVNQLSQGLSDTIFNTYHAQVVPNPWLLTKTVQSRIFQNLSVPDILKLVLTGFDTAFELTATYHPRNYCVQYRESDFDFASRLMEDEGIYYYFKHSDGGHKMVLSDAPVRHPELPIQSEIIYEQSHEGVQESMRVRTWDKVQKLCSAQYTVRDYCFEMPSGNLLESNPVMDQVKVGAVTHKFKLGGKQSEIYDYPGGYAKRYDAVDSQGGAYAKGLSQIFEDRSRTARIRMEEEECASVEITGTGDCGNFSPGYVFTLQAHSHGDGAYLLTSVLHNAEESGYRAGEKEAFHYDNRFACIPTGLIYRPRRATPKPMIASVQTATVTGPPGQSASGQSPFVDQYGRIKVQFHWDRQGQMNSNSSCWLRVGQIWAGNGWGAFFWPRAGQEVIVAFEDGDPDRPIVVGSVYNAANMPPYPLPASSSLGGIRSASVNGNSGQNFNGVILNDTLGKEHLSLHSENNMSLNAEKDKQFHGGGNKGERVYGYSVHTVGAGSGSGGGPEGGGSGGGSSPVTKPFNNYNNINYEPDPAGQTYEGMDITNCYGDAIALTAGSNLTWVLGSLTKRVVSPLEYLNLVASTGKVDVVGLVGMIAGGAAATVLPFPAAISEAISTSVAAILGSGATNTVCAKQTDFNFGRYNRIWLRPTSDNSVILNGTMTQSIPILLCSIGLLIDTLLLQILYLGYMGETDDSSVILVVEACNGIAALFQGLIKYLAKGQIAASPIKTALVQAVVGAKPVPPVLEAG